MPRAFIALGSNIPPRSEHLRDAVTKVGALDGCQVLGKSSLYETEPVGGPPQGMFLNAALEMETSLDPQGLLRALLAIEKAMGRSRREVNGPRIIDLDIIFYDDLLTAGPQLVIPHPRFRERGFVLFPLNDIIPDFVDPGTGKTVNTLLQEWQGGGGKGCQPLNPPGLV